jgi:hypothetical protein
MPGSGSAPDQHWRNFASVLGVDADAYDVPERVANPALGLVQVELLRRVNPHLSEFRRPVDRGTWIRGYLAERHLVTQDGERFGVEPDQLVECRSRADRAIAMIQEHGYDVVGDVETLRVPATQENRRRTSAVSSEELVESATRLVVAMLNDVRRLDPHGGLTGPPLTGEAAAEEGGL